MKNLLSICFFLLGVYPSINAQHLTLDELDHINYTINYNDAKVISVGETIEEKRLVDTSFEELVVGNGIQVFVTPNNSKEIRVIAQKSILPLVSTDMVDKKLTIQLSASLETSKGIKIYLPANNISTITMKEGSYLKILAGIFMKNLDLTLKSGALADCNINVDNFHCLTMGGSFLNLEGKVSQMADIRVKGGSVLKGKALECAVGKVTVLGASKCKLKVTDSLEARVENESLFAYSGNPTIKNKSTQLNGKIRRRILF